MLAGDLARQRLKMREQNKEAELERHLDTLIVDAAKYCGAMQATKLSQLLTKKWNQEDHAYKVASEIKTER